MRKWHQVLAYKRRAASQAREQHDSLSGEEFLNRTLWLLPLLGPFCSEFISLFVRLLSAQRSFVIYWQNSLALLIGIPRLLFYAPFLRNRWWLLLFVQNDSIEMHCLDPQRILSINVRLECVFDGGNKNISRKFDLAQRALIGEPSQEKTFAWMELKIDVFALLQLFSRYSLLSGTFTSYFLFSMYFSLKSITKHLKVFGFVYSICCSLCSVNFHVFRLFIFFYQIKKYFESLKFRNNSLQILSRNGFLHSFDFTGNHFTSTEYNHNWLNVRWTNWCFSFTRNN